MINNLIVSAVTIVFVILLGLGIELTMVSIMDKWCLYDPWYLLFKNTSIYIIIIFISLILLSVDNRKITRLASVLRYKRTIIISLSVVTLASLIGYGNFGWYYGNIGAGACSKSNINTDYYKYPGQDQYLN
jgi:hypothetical protein